MPRKGLSLLWRRPFKAAFSTALLLPVTLLAVGSAACRQDMHDNPRVEANEATDAFEDGQAIARSWRAPSRAGGSTTTSS